MNGISLEIRSSVTDGVAQGFAAQSRTISEVPSGPAFHSHRIQYDPHPSLLQDLRKFLGDPSATFKTPEQAEALEVSRNKTEHLLLVAPTAMGKSLVYMLPAAIYDRNLVTIVLLPLSSLHADFKRRCQELNIPTSRWQPPPAVPDNSTIVFVSPEHAQMLAFFEYAAELRLKKKLARVVIDEPHLIVQQSDFRYCFSNLKPLINSGMSLFQLV